MKRDPRLHGLSSDHHHALVLARRAERMTVEDVRARFDGEIDAHFVVEESILLPALRAVGAGELVSRTLEEHAAIREALGRGALGDFSELLTAHVRFEERELFPACEERLPSEVLDAVAERKPG